MLDPRFRKCDQCGVETKPPAAGVYYRNEGLWLCLSCPHPKKFPQETGVLGL